MYPVQLANRYLTSRIIPLIAVAAVALCVALVVIVVSVMSGFLDMLRASGRTLMGDVVITNPIRGIPWYGQLIETIEQLPQAQAATPLTVNWRFSKPSNQTLGGSTMLARERPLEDVVMAGFSGLSAFPAINAARVQGVLSPLV